MSSKSLTKSTLAVLGCAGAAVAAPFVAPYLATLSLPFFGAVLTGVVGNEQFREKLGEAISGAAAGLLTEIGGHFATDKMPRALSSEHNFHLERMLATAYLNSLAAIERELQAAGADGELNGQAAQILPSIKARLKTGLKEKEPSALFPAQAAGQPAGTTFAGSFSAERVTLLIADDERWREELGDEVETTLRRWLAEGREAEDKSARLTLIPLNRETRLPELLRTHLRASVPHRLAHQISELVKQDEFKESWIAFQRAYLQGMMRVVERIETSQGNLRESVDALARRIESLAGEDALVAALADMQREYLSRLSASHEELTGLLERQSEQLRGIVPQLSAKIDASAERLSDEGKEHAAHVSEKIAGLGAQVDESANRVIGHFDKTKDELKEILEGASRSARTRLKQLPTPPRDFTGRAAELKELRRALAEGGVTISGVQGMGGVGKTALALVLAEEFKDLYPDAQIYLDLKGVSSQPLSPAEVMWHVVSSFHPDMKRPDDAELPAWYSDLLNRHRALLFYDNAKDDAQIEPLLPPPHCLLLVTSRRHFQVPGMFHKNLEEMTGADAEALLLEIAPRIATDAAAIAKQCGRLPLALRLAASALHKSRALSPADLLRRLRDKRKRVELVEASFTLSYELLSDELQQRWRTLAVFPADFDAPAAAALWQTEVDAAKDSLTELEEYSLLDWEELTARYALHDLARDFADTRLKPAEREHSGFLHASHYLQILSTADELFLKGGEAIAKGLSLFDNERINIEVGQEWAAARFADNEPAAHLCNRYPDLGIYVLSLRQHPRDVVRWLEAGLSAARQLKDPASEGSHIGNLGAAYAALSETHRAIEFCEQQLTIAREIGDRRGEGVALGNLGNAYTNLGETRRAIEFFEQRLAIAREVGDRRAEGSTLGNLGVAYSNLGETRRAIEFYEQLLTIAREIGDRRGEGVALGNLGNAYTNLGETRRAIEFLEQRLAIAREIGDRLGEGNALGNLGLAYAYLGETRRAIEFYEQALVIDREIGDRRGEATDLGNMGTAYGKLGETHRAMEFYEQQLIITREIGDRRGESSALGNMGLAYATIGEPEKAIELMEAAAKIFEEIESPNAGIVRGWLEELRGKSG